MNRFLKTLLWLAVLLLTLAGASALAETTLSFSPENPRVGDYVDVTVRPGREAQSVRYELSTPAGVVYKSKAADLSAHFTASFRPREEAEYTLTAVIVYGKNDTETVSVTVPVSGTAPAQEGPDAVYSQKDGWWHKVMYRTKKPVETLEKGGCAIFTLSHLLQRLGCSGEEVLPASLAAKNTRFYIPGRGTDNGGLISQAAKDYDFVTESELIESEHEIEVALRHGDKFSFSIVIGHIALADGISEDGSMVHIVDSATGATFERKDRWKTKGHIYYQKEDGSFAEAMSADELPGIRWFFETGEYSGMEYWMDLHYCAHQGMRLVRLPWLKADTGSGLQTASLEYAGALVCKVSTGGESVRIPAKDAVWTTEGADGPQIAVVTGKKGAKILDGDGKPLEGFSKPLTAGTMLAVLGVEKDLVYVYWKDVFCWLSRKSVDLVPVSTEAFSTGIVSMNGRTAGTAKVTARNTPKSNGLRVADWTIGTPVAIVEAGKEYTLVEGKGSRGWIQNKYLTPDAAE
ncbi:MAG: hypothetical protein IKE15_09005 [Clostridia bacterium]|nr:hypothetical protein [Clostridia bacterium]